MKVTNETPYLFEYTTGYQKDCRELIVVMLKATYSIPENDSIAPELLTEQNPIIDADISTGEPGYSSILYESDYATFKPYCDVVLNGAAHSIIPVSEIDVALKISNQEKQLIDKRFRVIGNRTWRDKTPDYFYEMPISYDNAFGGIDDFDIKKIKIYRENMAGRGYSYHQKNISGMQLPNTEELNNPVLQPNGKYKPMAFGSISRSHPERIKYAGTYDKKWQEQRMPFWPDDFDFLFFQSVLSDQQMPYMSGGEKVTLTHLSPHSEELSFTLPRFNCPVLFIPYEGEHSFINPVVDTITIEPDHNRFSLLARAAYPIKRNFSEIKEIIIGQQSKGKLRSRSSPHKQFHTNLSDYLLSLSKTNNEQ